MEFNAFPKEELYLTFKLADGSGWLTSHRLILCVHEPGHLEGQAPEVYLLKDFKKAEVQNESLTVHFEGKRQAKIHLPINSSSLLQEIKAYVRQASEIRLKQP